MCIRICVHVMCCVVVLCIYGPAFPTPDSKFRSRVVSSTPLPPKPWNGNIMYVGDMMHSVHIGSM